VNTYSTRITAIVKGHRLEFSGDYVTAISKKHAQHILDTTERGYMRVYEILIATVDEETGKKVSYDNKEMLN